MGKKTVGRHDAKPPFRESDFAGRPQQEQAKLSGSLNLLSQQLVATRQVLQEIETSAPTPEPSPPAAEGVPVPAGQSSDDDTAVPR